MNASLHPAAERLAARHDLVDKLRLETLDAQRFQGGTVDLPSKATPVVGPGGIFGATLSVKDRRFAQARITLRKKAESLPDPSFAGAVNVRYFADLTKGNHERPLVHDLVQLKSRDVQIGEIWKGEASLDIFDSPTSELAALRPTSVGAGYRFSFAFTVDDLVVLKDLRS